MEFIKIRECLSVCVSFRHCCVPAVNVCVPVCACVCLIPTCLQLLVLFLLLLLLAKSNPWQRCLLAALTHRHTGTRTHRHSDSKLVCTLTHKHGQGVHAVLCCAMGRRLFCRRRRRRRCCCCCLFTCSYLMAISRNPKLSAGRACCLASRLACCC